MAYSDIAQQFINQRVLADSTESVKLYNLFKTLSYRVPTALIIKCCKNRRLQELVDKILGHSYGFSNLDDLLEPDQVGFVHNFEIYDSDHCPNCNTKGYISEEKNLQFDCSYCGHFLCKECVQQTKTVFPHTLRKKLELNCEIMCMKCYHISKDIMAHNSKDKKRFGRVGDIDIYFILKCIQEQDTACYLCNVPLLTMHYQEYCSYKFSIDRIDNSKPHDKDNVRITCYSCNCSFHPQYIYCPTKCHAKRPSKSTITAYKFNDFRRLTPVQYEKDKAIGKVYRSKVMHLCGIPIMMDWLNDNKSDNQFATYLLVEPQTGYAPLNFQQKVGTVILFRQDGVPLTKDIVEMIWNFLASLLCYSVVSEENILLEFNSWRDMIHTCKFKEMWVNFKKYY